MSKATPDLRLLDDVVAPRVLSAMRSASRALTSLGVRHAVAGGLAVGVHGYSRNTLTCTCWSATRRSSITKVW